MSIASRQVKKELNRIIESELKAGNIPTVEQIIAKLADFYKAISLGSPSFKARQQLYRKTWDIDRYNSNLTEIHNDINNLYEEMVDQFTIVLQDFDYYDTERRKVMYQINSLSADIQDLLLTAKDTEGYLYSVHDDFIDLSKVNLNYSTAEINTTGGAVTLRESRQGIAKIDMSSYFDIVNYPLSPVSQYINSVTSNKLFPKSTFGYAFSNINTSWIQQILKKTSGELVTSFTIDLDQVDKVGKRVSRIEMLGHAANPMLVEPLWSLDNINFRKLPTGFAGQQKTVSDNKKTIWNFTEINIRYLKFMITNSIEDAPVGNIDDPLYLYTIGFKLIELFSMAYSSEAVFYSAAHVVTDSTGEDSTIDKASLTVDHELQDGTQIKYYLSLGTDGVTNPALYNWIPISPVNDLAPSEPQVADFKHVAFFTSIPDIPWDSGSYGTALETFRGISLYKVYEFQFPPVRDSVSIYRGKNNWQVKETKSVRRKQVNDEKHSFGTSNTVTLSFPNFTVVEGDGLIRGSVVVKTDAGATPNFVYIDKNDYTVSYSQHTLTRGVTSKILLGNLPQNTVYVDYQYDEEIAEPTEYTTHIYVLNPEGVDINIVPFTAAQREAGQFLYFYTPEGVVDLSAESFYHITPGWHKVVTTAEPQTVNDRFYSVNNNQYLHQKVYRMYAYADKLQEVSLFELKYTTLKSDHSRYAIVDYDGDGKKEIIINYRPQTATWASSSDDLLNPSGGAEVYELSYKYISTQTNRIYLKAELSRNSSASSFTTPTLRSYTIKLGY